MAETLRHHPYPTAALPHGLDPASADSVKRFIHAHRFPSALDGRFLFAVVDEQEQLASVRLRHGLAGHREPPLLHRCAGGFHLIELHAPAVKRIEYRFSVVDGDGRESMIIDPLNPSTVRDPFAEKSVLAMADYRPPSYIADPPAAARGSLEELSIDGPLGKPWPTWIWSAPTATRNTPLPVIMFLDGGDWLQLAGADRILANLLQQHRIAPCRAVFLKPAARNEEYAANPRTAAFLADGLPCALADHLLWPSQRDQRLAVGVSLGALCLLHAHRSHPLSFGGLILQSGAFFQPRSDPMELDFPCFPAITAFISQALTRAPSERASVIPIHMTCGAGEENIVNNHMMADALSRQGFPLTFHKQPDAHNWTCWRDSIGTGLMRLLAP